jgi:hypothetical protein
VLFRAVLSVMGTLWVAAGLIAIVWVASALAVIPALLGVNWGIRRFSELGFIYSRFIIFMVFFMEDSWYLANLLTQTIGYYLFYIVRLGYLPTLSPMAILGFVISSFSAKGAASSSAPAPDLPARAALSLATAHGVHNWACAGPRAPPWFVYDMEAPSLARWADGLSRTSLVAFMGSVWGQAPRGRLRAGGPWH